MADALDLGSSGRPCGFKSRLSHHLFFADGEYIKISRILLTFYCAQDNILITSSEITEDVFVRKTVADVFIEMRIKKLKEFPPELSKEGSHGTFIINLNIEYSVRIQEEHKCNLSWKS
jgi:hypothetical protein